MLVRLVLAMVTLAATGARAADAERADPLPSWNDGPAKQAIVSFVQRVTTEGNNAYVPPAERVATFDNDGCLWAEKPFYFQAIFALDRVKAMAPELPEWRDQEPFASIIKGDTKAALAGGEKALAEVIMATHAGMTAEEFERVVLDWIATARHPTTGRPYTEMVYQPMLEVLAYLRASGFKTYIVSGGGIQFMRPWAERVYGVPPEQVVGSSVKTEYRVVDGEPRIVRLPAIDFIDDKAGKPIGIHRHIGRRPIIAFGNSDGDFQMLEYTTAGKGERLGVLIHHTDAEREWAYDRESPVGRLDRGLDEAPERGWTVVDMKRDWARVFPAASDEQADADSPVGEWVVKETGGAPAEATAPTLAITADGNATGTTGVNRFFGQAKIDGDSLRFAPLACTRMAGPPELMKQESRLMDAFQQTTGWKIDESGHFLLTDSKGSVLVRLTPRAP